MMWHSDEEVLELRTTISTLAMQKQYWWQRCTEHRDALRAAEAEVELLREALSRAERRAS
jgi:predicted  nucleic acid-binding Zn-ribbon protein